LIATQVKYLQIAEPLEVSVLEARDSVDTEVKPLQITEPLEVSVLDGRDLIEFQIKHLQIAEPLKVSVLEARDLIIEKAKPRHIGQEIGTIKVLDATIIKGYGSTKIAVKPRNIDEVEQSIAIGIGTIRTVTDGT
jgi:hypothetical protein